MKIHAQIVQDISGMDPIALTQIHELISIIKQQNSKISKPFSSDKPFLMVRTALKSCKGSLSQDIELDRSERL